jgi:hypothetical protein
MLIMMPMLYIDMPVCEFMCFSPSCLLNELADEIRSSQTEDGSCVVFWVVTTCKPCNRLQNDIASQPRMRQSTNWKIFMSI